MELDYTRISKTYDSYRSIPEEVLGHLVELGSIDGRSRVLDLGCGTGNAAAALRERAGGRVIGMDRSTAMLKKAGAKTVPVVCGNADGATLPFKSSSFDAIISIYVVHHIANLSGLFSECRRVLARGSLVIMTSGHSQIARQHPVIREFFPSLVRIDVARFPDIAEVDALLNKAGFDAVEHHETGVTKMPLDEVFLEKVKNKYISTYELIPEDEFRSGVKKLEAYIRGLRSPEFREWHATLLKATKRGS
jgi:ubiquinone/menaquinone biosynthesis C-methylase UbiE